MKWKYGEDIRSKKKKIESSDDEDVEKPEAFGMNTANFIMMKFYDVKFCVCRKAFFVFVLASSLDLI